MKVKKIIVCNFEHNFFDDKLIIVNCILDLDNNNKYKIKAMINNKCIDNLFININIVYKIYERLNIVYLRLNMSRKVKNYDEKRNKNIIHIIYSFMTIQNHIESSISMMIIKLNQRLIILRKS